MSTWSAAEIAFANAMPGYESRAQQTRLACTIEKALAVGDHLLAQAGTGTGKSFAGLVPAIGHALATGDPVIVATATKALQNQYVGDLEFLQATLDTPFTFALLKGRGNYVCRAKLAELVEQGPDSAFNLKGILEELETEGHSGDLEEFATQVDMRDKPRLTATADECPGKSDCPFGEICFAEKAKAKARESQVVVTNHSMLGMDLRVREAARTEKGEITAAILPVDVSAILIDEAHEFEAYMTSALGLELSSRSITSLTAQVASILDNPREVESVNRAARELFVALARFRGRQQSVKIDGRALVAHEDQFLTLLATLRDLQGAIQGVSTRGDDRMTLRKKRIGKRTDGLVDRLTGLMVQDDTEVVRWVENDERARDGQPAAILKFAPLHVGAFLKQALWSRCPAVLLSATLSVGNDFSYITGRLGLERPATFDAGTPFDYAKQMGIFIPEGFDPKQEGKWRAQVSVAIPELIRAADGRALVLFTSRNAMNEAYENTADAIRGMGYTVLRQGEDINPVLAAKFKSDETSVLFALKSFMTGFDVQGDALRLVIIDKLPYENPSDVIWSARCALQDRLANGNWSKKAFMTMTIPAMLLTLLQGIGRLIRSKSDEGVVAILDSRVFEPKAYTATIRRALPKGRMIRRLGDAVAHLEELTARRA